MTQNIYLASASLGIEGRFVITLDENVLRQELKLKTEEYPINLMLIGKKCARSTGKGSIGFATALPVIKPVRQFPPVLHDSCEKNELSCIWTVILLCSIRFAIWQ